MRIGLLLPTILASPSVTSNRIFAPLSPLLELADGLLANGHDVTIYSAEGLKTKAELIYEDGKYVDQNLIYYPFRNRDECTKNATTTEVIERDFEMRLTLSAYSNALKGKHDILHSYHDFQAHYFNEVTHFPTIYTLHDPLPQTQDSIEFFRFKKFANHNYVSISNSQRKGIVDMNFVSTVYHGLNTDLFEFNDSPDNHIIYFGRMIEEKGPHLALRLAIKTHTPIHVATSLSLDNQTFGYFQEKIKPLLSNSLVKVVGKINDDKAKSDYIRSAKAFIFPLQWSEPFGLTVIESMACGTPVVAFNVGSMHELIIDGLTGFLVDPKEGFEGLLKAFAKIDTIDRRACREHIEKLFTKSQMVKGYESIYQSILSSKPQ